MIAIKSNAVIPTVVLFKYLALAAVISFTLAVTKSVMSVVSVVSAVVNPFFKVPMLDVSDSTVVPSPLKVDL